MQQLKETLGKPKLESIDDNIANNDKRKLQAG